MTPGLPRLLAGVGESRVTLLHEHLERHRGLPGLPPDEVIALAAQSGLRGCGGGAFPAAAKLDAVRSAGGRPIVVANGTEGEPASRKDALLLASAPHLVLDGIELAARAVGARRAHLCVCERSSDARRAVEVALRERAQAPGKHLEIELHPIPPAFLAGEETALVNHLNGGPLKPTLTPPRPSQRGVGGRPTLVNNVETLAHLALIARHGARWFRELGSDAAPGSRLVTLSGAVASPGVFEVTAGMRLADVAAAAGGPTSTPCAVLVGGYFGSWVAGDAVPHMTLAADSLAAHGATFGAGTIALLGGEACGVAETARIVAYLARESAGQCGPCVFGLRAIADAWERLANGAGDGHETARLARWSAQVRGRGACSHPDGAANLVDTALRVFADEIALHETGRCRAPGAPGVLPIPLGDSGARAA